MAAHALWRLTTPRAHARRTHAASAARIDTRVRPLVTPRLRHSPPLEVLGVGLGARMAARCASEIELDV